MTISAASVKPCSLRLPRVERRSIESIPGSLALYVDDARLAGGAEGGRIDRHRRRVAGAAGRVGRGLHFLPIRLLRERVLRDIAQVVVRLQRGQAVGILLLVGVVVVDG